MNKAISYLLIFSIIFSVFYAPNGSFVFATFNESSNHNSVEETGILPEILPDSEIAVGESEFYGVFSKEQFELIKSMYSPVMKQIAAYYYPELNPMLEQEQLIKVLAWSNKDILSRIPTLSSTEYELLKQHTPTANILYESINNRSEYMNSLRVLVDSSNTDYEELIGKVDKDERVDIETDAAIAPNLNELSNLSSTNPYAFSEKNVPNPYITSTDGTIDPIMKTSSQQDVDVYLPGRNGLDFSIVRSYSSLNAKVLDPLYDGIREYDMTAGNYVTRNGHDGMGNRTEIHWLNSLEKPNYIATGWGLNIPSLEIGTTHRLSRSIGRLLDSTRGGTYNRSYGEGISQYSFTLDDGSSYIFRGNSTTAYNHPYSNVTYKRQGSNYLLTIDQNITYAFNDKGVILNKTNKYGDQITYQNNSAHIVITDSIGRVITITRNNNERITGFTVKDSSNALLYSMSYDVSAISVNKDTKQILLKTFMTNANKPYGYFDEYDYIYTSLRYFQLNKVTDNMISKVVKEYSYKEIDVTTAASFNFEDDYFFKADSNYKPILDVNERSDASKIVNGAESSQVMERDIATYAEIQYLLLKQVKGETGVTINYQYKSYDNRWHVEDSSIGREIVKGTTNLYMDSDTLLYVGYHPVVSVNYMYTDTSGRAKLYTQDVSGYLPGTKNEVWTRPKEAITEDGVVPYRLLDSNTSRKGDQIKTELSSFFSEYYTDNTAIYRPNGKGNTLKILEENAIQYSSNNFTDMTEGDLKYLTAQKQVTSYYYEQGHTKPSLVFLSDKKPQNDPKPAEIKRFIDGLTSTVPSNLANFVTLNKFTYDSFGYPIEVVDPLGNKEVYQYNGPKHQLSSKKMVASDGYTQNEEVYEYNTEGFLSGMVTKSNFRNPSDGTTKTDIVTTAFSDYNQYKQPRKSVQTSSGHQYAMQPTSMTKEWKYDPLGIQIVEETTLAALSENSVPQSLTLNYEYDKWNRLKKQSYPDGSVADYGYDSKNRTTSETYTPSPQNPGPSRSNVYVYEDSQRKITQTLPDGEQLIIYYTPYGQVEKQLRKVGTNEKLVVINEMDRTGLLLKASLPYGETTQKTTYTYSIFGTPKEIINPLGVTTYAYSNAAYKTDGSGTYLQTTAKMVSPDGQETWSYQDRMGRVIKEVEKNSNKIRTTQYEYTPLGQVASIAVSGDGVSQTTQYKYDGQGNLIYLKDNEGVVNSYIYNHLGQVISWSINGELQKQTKYNEAGWILSKTDAAGKKETYQYGNTGLLNNYTDNSSQSHQYSYTPYDEVKRLSIRNTAGAEVYWKEMSYNPTTRLVESLSTSDNESLGYHYDEWKRMDTQIVANRTYTMGYDTKDRLETITYPDQKKVKYTYDNANRLETVNYPGMDTVSYDYTTNINENKGTLTYPNGVVQERIANSFGELTSYKQTSVRPELKWDETISYDTFSNIKGINRNNSSQSFKYDGLNRITDESTPEGSRKYTYDVKGNRQTVEGDTPFVDVDLEEYTYNADNTLKTYTSSEGIQATYKYYGDGLRASKEVNGKYTRYVNLNGHIIEELNKDGSVKARNIWGNELLYRHDAEANKEGYYSYNSHGDVVKITDASGTTLNIYDYDIWGNLLSQSETGISNPFKYTGEVYDEESGLYYLRARYYDPSIGRFINKDTYEGDIANPLSLNLYTYVENNPLIYIDPTGHRKASDNEELIQMTEQFEEDYYYYKNKNNKEGMLDAEKSADLLRVAYYNMYGLDIPDDVKYTSITQRQTEGFRLYYMQNYPVLELTAAFYQGKIPLSVNDLVYNPELMHGLGPERTMKMFRNAGYIVSDVMPQTSGNGYKIYIKGHSINYVQWSNANGRHGVSYLKIGGNLKNIYGGNTLKIVMGSPSTYKGNIKEEMKAGTVFRWFRGRGNRA